MNELVRNLPFITVLRFIICLLLILFFYLCFKEYSKYKRIRRPSAIFIIIVLEMGYYFIFCIFMIKSFSFNPNYFMHLGILLFLIYFVCNIDEFFK